MGRLLKRRSGIVPLGCVLWLAGFTWMAAALESAPKGEAEAHFKRAVELTGLGKLDEAEREYLAGLRLSPQSPAAYNDLGVLYFKRNDFAHAAGAFEKARKLKPGDPEIAFNLGLALYKSGDAAQAVPHLKAGADQAHAQDAHYLLGASYFATRQWKECIAELELFRKQTPDKPEVLFMLVSAYRSERNPGASLDAAAELLRSHPDSPFTHQMLGEAYDRDGQPDQAATEFKLAIAASPSDPQLHFMLGYLYWRWKRYAEALTPLQDEVRINPGFAPSYFYLGDMALRQDDAKAAQGYFQKALRLDPSYSEAMLGLGKTYVRMERLEEGIATLRKAAATLDNREVHYWLGRALMSAGHAEEGRKELAKVARESAEETRKAQEVLNGAPVGERVQTQIPR